MSKPTPTPAPTTPDPRIMFDGYKWRVLGVSRTHAPAFLTQEEAVTHLNELEQS